MLKFLRRLAVVLVVAAVPAFAQGTHFRDNVTNKAGNPVAGAGVRICVSGSTGTPCTPLASIYSDSGLTSPITQPGFTTGSDGVYEFYAAPGRYDVQISGSSFNTVTVRNVNVPCDVSQAQAGCAAASIVNSPQTSSATPVQVGWLWYPGTQSGLVTAPTSGPTLTNESNTGGTIAGNQTIYCVDVYENRNGTTTQSPQTSLAIPAGTNTNMVAAVQGDLNWRTGAKGYRLYCGTANGGPYYLQQQQVLSVNISSVVASAANGYTGGGGNWALVTTSSAHGVWTGMSVTIAGVTSCSGGSPNGTFTVTRSPSNTSFVISIGSGVSGCDASSGTVSWTNEINANHAHLTFGYFIMSQLNGSGPTPPGSNTAVIDPLQVALNATCPGGPQANVCAGILQVPAAGATLTTELIVSNQEELIGPTTPRSGTSPITCSWADPWAGCVMVIGSSGSESHGIYILSAGNGLMLAGTNVSSRFVGGSIVSGYPGAHGLYGAVRIMSGTGQIFSNHFEDVYMSGDRAAVFITNSIGSTLVFNGGRWDTVISAFADESGPGDPDRMGIGVGGAISGVVLQNIIAESGTGVMLDLRNIGPIVSNFLLADATPAANTPAPVRLGIDSWGSGSVINTEFRNIRFISSGNYGAVVQYTSNSGNSFGIQLFENVTFGGNTVCIDEGSVLGTTPIALINVGQCDPTPGAGHVINYGAAGTGISVVGAYGSGYPSMFGRSLIQAPEAGGFPSKARHWFIDTATNNNYCLNPPGTFTTNAITQADFCVDNAHNLSAPNGSLKAFSYIFGGTPGVTGCSVTNVLGGATGGSFKSGTTGTCTVTITPGITATNGIGCWAKDLTTPADEPKQTAYTTTTATLSWTTVSGDLITYGCGPF